MITPPSMGNLARDYLLALSNHADLDE
uniref:Uncharacterized protein n=1 Tax=Arundo donax TaxID=35708 RepID=A0A0A9AJ60_ARUDO